MSESSPAPVPARAGARWPVVQPWLTTTARVVVGAVMLWAGLAKVSDLPASVRAVRAFELLPEVLAKPVGYGMPVLEITVGLLLVVGLLSRYAGAIVALLMLAFIVGIASAWARGLAIDCGCFGGGGPTDPGTTQYPLEIVRDLAIGAGAAFVAVRPRSRFSLDQTLGLVVADDERP